MLTTASTKLISVVPATINTFRQSSGVADIVVAGGGMIGTAAATALAKLAGLQQYKIILLESAPKKEIQLSDHYSNRVSALSPATKHLLDRLGAWDLIKKCRYQPVKKMQIWDSCSDASIDFDEGDGGHVDDPLAYLVENDLTVKSLTEVLESCPNVEVRYGAKVKSYKIPQLDDLKQVSTDLVKIQLEGGDTIETSLLVGADGLQSLVRRSLENEGEYISWQYNQMGIVATLTLESSPDCGNTTAWQRFLSNGPIALLPLDNTHSSLVWTVSKEDAPTLVKMEENIFVEKLNAVLLSRSEEQGLALAITSSIGTILGEQRERPSPPLITNALGRAAFPLGFGHSPRYIGSRTVLVGDSAHRVHPLAGQGANLGFGDVRELTEQVQDMVLDGAGLGHRDYLKHYETARQRHNVPTMLGMDGLQKLYCTSSPPVVMIRSLGLSLTAACTPLRKMIQDHAAA